MNERDFEQAASALSISYMAGWALVAIAAFQNEDGRLPPESRKALEESLAFVKKVNAAEEALKKDHLSLSSLESFNAYSIAKKVVRFGGDGLLKGKEIGVFLKTVESTIEALIKNGNVNTDDVEETRVFFSQLMHATSSKGGCLLSQEGTSEA